MATTIIDFIGRAIVIVIALLALRRSPIGFWGVRTDICRGARTSVYLLRLVARIFQSAFVTIAFVVISIVRGEYRECSFSNLLTFLGKDLLYKYVKVVEYFLLL